MAEKVHISRGDLKGPDGFITLTGKALSWARQNQQLVTAAGIGAVLIVVALGVAGAYRHAQERDANVDLARAMSKLQTSQFAAAATDLADLSSRWSSTRIGPVAGVLAAGSAVQAGEADKALEIIAELQPEIHGLPPYLRQQFYVAWGAALESKQQWQDAAARYQEAVTLTGPYGGEALVGEARALEQAGETDKARELYRQAYEQFPELPSRELLASKFGA